MTTTELIDRAIAYYDNISTTDAGYGQRVTRTLYYLQQVYDQVWHEAEWTFKYTEFTGSALAGVLTVALPTNFEEFGKYGKFLVRSSGSTGTYSICAERDALETYEAQNLYPTGVEELPSIFSLVSGVVRIPGGQAAFDYKYIYVKAPITLAYTAPDDQFDIPAKYHWTVLLPGTVAKMQEAKGDARSFETHYKEGLRTMKRVERAVKTEPMFLPPAVPLDMC